METTSERRKPGRRPGPEMRKVTIMMEPELAEWGIGQPEGLSPLVRQLLRDERRRREAAHEAGPNG